MGKPGLRGLALAAALAACAGGASGPPSGPGAGSAPPPVPDAVPVAPVVADELPAPAIPDAAPAVAQAPWCSQAYDPVPCTFRWQGGCHLKVVAGRAIDEDAGDFAYTACRTDAPPDFMTKARWCGRRGKQSVVKVKSQYMDTDATCNSIATAWANVRHEDRLCATDADCTVVIGDGNCQYMAIATAAPKRKWLVDAPCGNPASGACAGAPDASCVDGCCMIARGGLAGWGTAESIYPKLELP